MSIADYHASAVDWRTQLKINERKTRKVIALFFLIYIIVGLIADTLAAQSMYPHVASEKIFMALITFKLIPYLTFLMIVIGLVSLWVTYAFYDRIMLLGTDYHEITPQSAKTIAETQLYNVVEEMKIASGLHYMPKVFIIEANYMNAFASGYSEQSAMVAITRGLIEKLDRAELQAVMAHELSHVKHHDIKLTLMVAVLSNIILMVIDMLFYSVLYKRDDREDNKFLIIIIILRYTLPVVTILLALFLSRTREFMADAGCVELMRDNEPLARALIKINFDHQEHADEYTKEYGATPHEQVRHTSYLFDPSDIDPVKSMSNAFATHPSVQQRLIALGFKQANK
ncbi:MAG: zinc metalloprotease HtpX [bacterium]|nr:zinc metalloprotease HtpX [bacterium]